MLVRDLTRLSSDEKVSRVMKLDLGVLNAKTLMTDIIGSIWGYLLANADRQHPVHPLI
jgi:hypothetical protein